MPPADPAFDIEPFSDKHRPLRAAFRCGVRPLDEYIRTRAGQDSGRRVAAVFVAVETASRTLAGYYTLASAFIVSSELPPQLRKRFPKYPTLPATLLGRLAVDLRFRGRGVGELLLMDALWRSYEHSREIASIAVVVDAKDDAARTFYEHYGFVSIPSSGRRLFLLMETIAQLFR